jgi:Zn-dependent protease
MSDPDPPPFLTDPAAAKPKDKKRKAGAWATITLAVGKVLSQFKFALIFLKTGGSMLLVMWLYAMVWGWPYAAGFVLLILIHECGHLVVARAFGLKVGAPVFIPFMGAFIALKEAPPDAWVEACVGIGGPIFGTLGAIVCGGIYYSTGNPLFRALAYSGCFLNLFNLTPITPLDGGRIASAVSPWLWLVGLVVIGTMMFFHFNFVLLLIVILSLPRVYRLLRGREASPAYFHVSPGRRWTMAVLYFGLTGFLAASMQLTKFEPRPRAPIQGTL